LAALLRPWRLLVVVEIRGAWWSAVRMGGRLCGSMSSRVGTVWCIVVSRVVVAVSMVSMIDICWGFPERSHFQCHMKQLVMSIRYNYNSLNALRRIQTIFIQRRKEKKKTKEKHRKVVVVAGAGASMLVVAKYVLHASRKQNPSKKTTKSVLVGVVISMVTTKS
jgi:uncharacterized protein YndB with AHSA1/START domain